MTQKDDFDMQTEEGSSISSIRSNKNMMLNKQQKTELDHMFIRDATLEEKDQIRYET